MQTGYIKERGEDVKRFYYDDPLAAAWMWKHFGMEFEGADTIIIEIDEILSAALKPYDKRIDYCVPQIMYIHPDSLHLLEPMVGDVVIEERHDGRFSNDILEDNEDFPWALTVKKISKMRMKPWIVQRNGLPFHWPLSEEV